MKLTKLLMLLLIAGLITFYVLYDVKGKPKREKAEVQAKRLFPNLKKDDVVSLAVEQLTGKDPLKLTIDYSGGKWVSEGPPPTQLSDTQVGGAAKALIEISESKDLTSTASPAPAPAEFGLDKPSYKLTLRSKDGQTHILTLGDETPDGSGYYAQTEKGPIYSIGSGFKDVLHTPADKLREVSPLPVEPSKANRVVVTLESGTRLEASLKTPREKPAEEAPDNVQITNLSEEWKLVSPEQASADGNKVRDLLFAWKNLKAGRFLKPEENIKFDKPKLKLEVWVDGKDKPQVMEVGQAVEVNKKLYYLHRLDPDETMVVELNDPKVLTPDINTLRNRHLANFEVDAVQRIEAKVGDSEMSGRKDGGGTWRLQKPAQINPDDSQRNQAVTDLLWGVKNTEWSEPAKDAKTLTPRATISIFGKDDAVLGKVVLGQASGKGALVQLGDDKKIYQLSDDPYSRWEGIVKRAGAPVATPSTPTPRAAPPTPAAATPGPATPAAATPGPPTPAGK